MPGSADRRYRGSWDDTVGPLEQANGKRAAIEVQSWDMES